MTDLQKWAKEALEQYNNSRMFADIFTGGLLLSGPYTGGGGFLVGGFFKLVLQESEADKYYKAELYKIYQGTRFTKITMEEARRLYPS